jgi:hypothetical protein
MAQSGYMLLIYPEYSHIFFWKMDTTESIGYSALFLYLGILILLQPKSETRGESGRRKDRETGVWHGVYKGVVKQLHIASETAVRQFQGWSPAGRSVNQ